MDKYPNVYPSDVSYRPGRVQSLTSDQEIVLKQAWAVLLKYWGYEVDLSTQDIHNKQAFVASSVTHSPSLTAVSTAISTAELRAKTLKKKKSFFQRKKAEAEPETPISTRRQKQLANSGSESYVEITEVSKSVQYIFSEHYKEGLHHQEDLEEDTSDVESFYSALTTVEVSNAEETEVKQKTGKVTEESVVVREVSSGLEVQTHQSIFPFMKKYDPKTLHNSMMTFARNDLMDNLVMRYIRARKYLLPDSIKMLANSLDWKVKGYMANKLLLEGDAPSYVNGRNKGFVKNFTVGKSCIRGHDKNGNPLFFFQSRKHFAHDSPLEETEQFALVLIEWCRLHLREVNESVDTCSIVFDLSGFSLKNADNAPVKFLTAMFEAHYPECLGIVVIHNAPWIFSTVWNIIKNWLDPVVASKIHFTKGFDEINKFIDAEHIPADMGGDDDLGNAYDCPTEEHTLPPLTKDDTYRQLRRNRDELHMKFIETTIKWVESTNLDVSSRYLKEKILLSYQLSDNYIELDPYIRNPGIYDRRGTLKLRN